jgi:glycosyltransferase involved in cell wall biosynthesis
MRWMLRRAARVITVSERLREFAIGLGAAPQRVITIPNGVDAATFYPRNREECRRRLGIAPEERLIVAAGHLIPLKGHHHMIRAVRALVDRGWNATLAIAGDAGASASHEDFLRSEVSRLGLEERVRFLGRKPPAAVAEYMSAADVFCLASSREGWPNVVHEALSCGTPVVATAVGAAPQMIPREEYGILLPPESVDRLDEPLERALAADWDRAAIAAWGRARSWEQVAEEVAAEMRAAAQGR